MNDFVVLTLYSRVREAGKALEVNAEDRSQTQPETQPVVNIETRTKRKGHEEQTGRSKRMKVSLGDAMDLGD